MRLDPRGCPEDVDEIAEQYVMNRLPEADANAFEQHTLSCAGCAAMVQQTEAYIQTLRAALERVEQKGKRPSRFTALHCRPTPQKPV
jgi:anti-sigma factor RsiW